MAFNAASLGVMLRRHDYLALPGFDRTAPSSAMKIANKLAGSLALAFSLITCSGLEERLACFVDPDRPCCRILRTNPAGQYVRKDATVVMVNTGFSTWWVFDHLRRQSLPEHVWELDHEHLPYGLIVSFDRSIDLLVVLASHKGSAREPERVLDRLKNLHVIVDSKNSVPVQHRWSIHGYSP
jgi:hypothetical protein